MLKTPGERLSISPGWELTREAMEDPNAVAGLRMGRRQGVPGRALRRPRVAATRKPRLIMAEPWDQVCGAAGSSPAAWAVGAARCEAGLSAFCRKLYSASFQGRGLDKTKLV